MITHLPRIGSLRNSGTADLGQTTFLSYAAVCGAQGSVVLPRRQSQAEGRSEVLTNGRQPEVCFLPMFDLRSGRRRTAASSAPDEPAAVDHLQVTPQTRK